MARIFFLIYSFFLFFYFFNLSSPNPKNRIANEILGKSGELRWIGELPFYQHGSDTLHLFTLSGISGPITGTLRFHNRQLREIRILETHEWRANGQPFPRNLTFSIDTEDKVPALKIDGITGATLSQAKIQAACQKNLRRMMEKAETRGEGKEHE